MRWTDANTLNTPAFSWKDDFTNVLTMTSDGGTIYYTDDGSVPTAESTQYNATNGIDAKDLNGKMIKAVAKAATNSDKTDSNVGSFKVELCTVTFSADGGSGSDITKTIHKNGKIKQSALSGAFTKAGYKDFDAATGTWKNGNADFDFSTAITASITLKPLWEEILVTNVKLNCASSTVQKGKTLVLTANVTPSNALHNSVVWATSNASIATIAPNANDKNQCTVTAVAEGTVTITASAGTQSATCTLNVINEIVFDTTSGVSNITLEAGKNYYFTGSITGADFKSIMEKIPNGSNDEPITMDFSECKIIGGTIPDGTFDAPVIPNIFNDTTSTQYKISSLVLPQGLTKVPDYLARATTSLTSVTIPDTVTSIGEGAFYECYALTSVTISDSVTSIENYAFYECRSLTSVTIPDSVTSIGEGAFYECRSLTSVTIPDTVTSIGNYAFYECYALTSVTIPSSVTSIGDFAFVGCTSLTSITVDSGNTNYSSQGGVLFNKDKTTLILYPAKKTDISYIIPDSVTKIWGGAFVGCTSLTDVTIPASVTSIGDAAFNDCSSITRIFIPNTVLTMGSYVFIWTNCTYSQTVAVTWAEGNKPNGWDNNWNGGSNVTIQYGATQ